jgi:hypothetical protein
LASSAGAAARAAASAARTSSSTSAWVVALPVTEPTDVPPACLTNDTIETCTPCITPLVVSVLLAQRRLALVESRTIATQSSLIDAATACSTSDCGLMPWGRLIGRTPGWC